MEIRRAIRPRARRPLLCDLLRAALLVVAGTLFFVASLAGYLLIAVMGVAALRVAFGAVPRRGAAGTAPRAPTGGVPGPRLRLVPATDDAA